MDSSDRKCRSDFGPRAQRDAEIRTCAVEGRAVGLGNVQMRFKAIGFRCYGCEGASFCSDRFVHSLLQSELYIKFNHKLWISPLGLL